MKYIIPRGSVTKKTYKFRIFPSKEQVRVLNETLDLCRWTYNQTLAYRKNLWETEKKNTSKYDSHYLLPIWKQEKPELKNVFSQVLQNVQERVDLAFQAFFRRVKAHENPGYPRFKGRGWYDSFTYPQGGFGLKNDKILWLSKIGEIKIKLHRKIEGAIKRLTVNRSIRGKWYVSFSTEQPLELKLSQSDLVTGVDLGLTNFATFSDGNKIENPRFFRTEEKILSKAQSKRDKLPKGSLERNKVTKVVQRIHERITNKRLNFAHQLSHDLVEKYGVLCFEDLNIKSMLAEAPRGLAKSISDASWNILVRLTQYKAESAGSVVVLVDPKNTSQMCSRCGVIVPKDLSVRVHKCTCGLEMDRDQNAALNILRLGLQSLGQIKRVVEAPLFHPNCYSGALGRGVVTWAISPWPDFWSMGKDSGTPSYYYSLLTLVKAGHEVHLFAPGKGLTREEIPGVYVHHFSIPAEGALKSIMGSVGRNLIEYKILEIIYYKLFNYAAFFRIMAERLEKPALIYAYTSQSVPAAYALSKIYSVPYITRLFGTFITLKDLKSPLRLLGKWQEVLAFKFPGKYLIVTDDGTQGDKIAKHFGAEDKLKFWRNGVNKDMCDPNFDRVKFCSENNINPSCKIALTVSRLSSWKRVDRVIKAIPSIVKEYKDVIFLILGDGSEKESLEKLSFDLKVSDYVQFRGAVSRDKVADYMNAADIFVSTNDFSNVSNGLYEAMVCGKCIVTLDNGGTGELIKNNITGKLIQDKGDLGTTIVDVLKNDELRSQLGQNAREYAQSNFKTWEERIEIEAELIKGGIL
jgi:putative transposase